MKSVSHEDMLFEELYQVVRARFHVELRHVEQIKRGWLNRKWKIETHEGTYLLKQYNQDRLKKYSINELHHVFSEQNRLHSLGFPCPKIFSDEDEVFFETLSGERFIMMEFCSGQLMKPGKLTDEQMFQLGYYTGKMHAFLNDGKTPTKKNPVFVPPSKDERMGYWKKVLNEVSLAGKYELSPIIEKQLQLMEVFQMDQLNLKSVGWAHRDLWVDNMLFQENQLSAILDFDRLNYDHLLLDVGRAIISGALDGDSLHVKGIKSFVQGYSLFRPTGEKFIADALKLLWYLESEWWLDVQMDQRKGPPIRFVQEMIWLSEHLLKLDEMLAGT